MSFDAKIRDLSSILSVSEITNDSVTKAYSKNSLSSSSLCLKVCIRNSNISTNSISDSSLKSNSTSIYSTINSLVTKDLLSNTNTLLGLGALDGVAGAGTATVLISFSLSLSLLSFASSIV